MVSLNVHRNVIVYQQTGSRVIEKRIHSVSTTRRTPEHRRYTPRRVRPIQVQVFCTYTYACGLKATCSLGRMVSRAAGFLARMLRAAAVPPRLPTAHDRIPLRDGRYERKYGVGCCARAIPGTLEVFPYDRVARKKRPLRIQACSNTQLLVLCRTVSCPTLFKGTFTVS